MSDMPKFANPPIVELVIGAQFSPLTRTYGAGRFTTQPSQNSSFQTEASDRNSTRFALGTRLIAPGFLDHSPAVLTHYPE